MILEDYLQQAKHLKPLCEQIRGRVIKPRTWANWEDLAGAHYPQGKKVSDRRYTWEQTQMLLCLAWMRKQWPTVEISYKSLRDFHAANIHKLEAVLDLACEQTPIAPQPKRIYLIQAKKACDAIAGRELSRECWANWKEHLGIAKYSKWVDEGTASLLAFMACWRQDHPRRKFPSPNQLILMMQRRQVSMETVASSRNLHRWEMEGCTGKDLRRYLAAHGIRVSLSALYKWGGFTQKRHYTAAELQQWLNLAKEKMEGRG